jgi:hypothetical protein
MYVKNAHFKAYKHVLSHVLADWALSKVETRRGGFLSAVKLTLKLKTHAATTCFILSMLTQALSMLSYTHTHAPRTRSFVEGRINSRLVLS